MATIDDQVKDNLHDILRSYAIPEMDTGGETWKNLFDDVVKNSQGLRDAVTNLSMRITNAVNKSFTDNYGEQPSARPRDFNTFEREYHIDSFRNDLTQLFQRYVLTKYIRQVDDELRNKVLPKIRSGAEQKEIDRLIRSYVEPHVRDHDLLYPDRWVTDNTAIVLNQLHEESRHSAREGTAGEETAAEGSSGEERTREGRSPGPAASSREAADREERRRREREEFERKEKADHEHGEDKFRETEGDEEHKAEARKNAFEKADKEVYEESKKYLKESSDKDLHEHDDTEKKLLGEDEKRLGLEELNNRIREEISDDDDPQRVVDLFLFPDMATFKKYKDDGDDLVYAERGLHTGPYLIATDEWKGTASDLKIHEGQVIKISEGYDDNHKFLLACATGKKDAKKTSHLIWLDDPKEVLVEDLLGRDIKIELSVDGNTFSVGSQIPYTLTLKGSNYASLIDEGKVQLGFRLNDIELSKLRLDSRYMRDGKVKGELPLHKDLVKDLDLSKGPFKLSAYLEIEGFDKKKRSNEFEISIKLNDKYIDIIEVNSKRPKGSRIDLTYFDDRQLMVYCKPKGFRWLQVYEDQKADRPGKLRFALEMDGKIIFPDQLLKRIDGFTIKKDLERPFKQFQVVVVNSKKEVLAHSSSMIELDYAYPEMDLSLVPKKRYYPDKPIVLGLEFSKDFKDFFSIWGKGSFEYWLEFEKDGEELTGDKHMLDDVFPSLQVQQVLNTDMLKLLKSTGGELNCRIRIRSVHTGKIVDSDYVKLNIIAHKASVDYPHEFEIRIASEKKTYALYDTMAFEVDLGKFGESFGRNPLEKQSFLCIEIKGKGKYYTSWRDLYKSKDEIAGTGKVRQEIEVDKRLHNLIIASEGKLEASAILYYMPEGKPSYVRSDPIVLGFNLSDSDFTFTNLDKGDHDLDDTINYRLEFKGEHYKRIIRGKLAGKIYVQLTYRLDKDIPASQFMDIKGLGERYEGTLQLPIKKQILDHIRKYGYIDINANISYDMKTYAEDVRDYEASRSFRINVKLPEIVANDGVDKASIDTLQDRINLHAKISNLDMQTIEDDKVICVAKIIGNGSELVAFASYHSSRYKGLLSPATRDTMTLSVPLQRLREDKLEMKDLIGGKVIFYLYTPGGEIGYEHPISQSNSVELQVVQDPLFEFSVVQSRYFIYDPIAYQIVFRGELAKYLLQHPEAISEGGTEHPLGAVDFSKGGWKENNFYNQVTLPREILGRLKSRDLSLKLRIRYNLQGRTQDIELDADFKLDSPALEIDKLNDQKVSEMDEGKIASVSAVDSSEHLQVEAHLVNIDEQEFQDRYHVYLKVDGQEFRNVSVGHSVEKGILGKKNKLFVKIDTKELQMQEGRKISLIVRPKHDLGLIASYTEEVILKETIFVNFRIKGIDSRNKFRWQAEIKGKDADMLVDSGKAKYNFILRKTNRKIFNNWKDLTGKKMDGILPIWSASEGRHEVELVVSDPRGSFHYSNSATVDLSAGKKELEKEIAELEEKIEEKDKVESRDFSNELEVIHTRGRLLQWMVKKLGEEDVRQIFAQTQAMKVIEEKLKIFIERTQRKQEKITKELEDYEYIVKQMSKKQMEKIDAYLDSEQSGQGSHLDYKEMTDRIYEIFDEMKGVNDELYKGLNNLVGILKSSGQPRKKRKDALDELKKLTGLNQKMVDLSHDVSMLKQRRRSMIRYIMRLMKDKYNPNVIRRYLEGIGVYIRNRETEKKR